MSNNEKKLYRIQNTEAYDALEKYVKLSEENIKFLEWLNNNEMLACNTEYEEMTAIPEAVEF